MQYVLNFYMNIPLFELIITQYYDHGCISKTLSLL